MLTVNNFRELKEALARHDLSRDTRVDTNLGFLAALFRQSDRAEVRQASNAAFRALVSAVDPCTPLTPNLRLDLARDAVDLGEALVAELEARGHVAGR